MNMRAHTHTHILSRPPDRYLGQFVHQPLVAVPGTDQPQALKSAQVPQDTPLLLCQRQEGVGRQRAVSSQRLRGLGFTGLASAHQPLVGCFLGGREAAGV